MLEDSPGEIASTLGNTSHRKLLHGPKATSLFLALKKTFPYIR
jgi:hypothetical protein